MTHRSNKGLAYEKLKIHNFRRISTSLPSEEELQNDCKSFSEKSPYKSAAEMEASNDKKKIELHYNQIIPGKSGNYIIQEFLGSGGYGQVVKAIEQETGEIVAIKFIDWEHSQSAEREVAMLKLIGELVTDQNSFIKLVDNFIFGKSFCLVFEKLDMNLFDVLRKGNGILDVPDIRVVAYDLLVALSLLRNVGVTHVDIKPDNVMLINHQSQPFRVKLIDFGLAVKTCQLWQYETAQVCGFRAPEVFLGLRKHEAIDTWAVACTLAYLFLGEFLHEPTCEYNCMKQIFKIHGLPDKRSLEKGSKVDRFFIFDQSKQTWRFKTSEEFTETGNKIASHEIAEKDFRSLDDLLKLVPGIEDPYELEDLRAFVDLLKRMLTVDPAERITPEDALKHPFITMIHLPRASNSPYVKSAHKRMKVCEIKEGGITSPSSDPIRTNAADRSSSIFDFNPSDYDLSDDDLSDSEISDTDSTDSGLTDFDLFDSDLSDLESDTPTFKSGSEKEIITGNQFVVNNWMDSFPRQSPKPDEPAAISASQQNRSNQEASNDTTHQPNLSLFNLAQGSVITGNLGVYIVQRFLGRGSYGEVVECITQGTGEIVAVKLIHKENHLSAKNEARALSCLRQLDVDENNLVKLIEFFEFNGNFCFVLEMLDMSFSTFFKRNDLNWLDIHAVRVIAQNLLVALSALKTLGLTHADIKPDNIMLVNHQSQPFRVKLIDFGFAVKTQALQRYETFQVVGFRAPEVFLGLPVDEGVDTWAVACVLACLCLGNFLHEPSCEYNNMRLIVKLHGLPHKSLLEKGSKVHHFFTFDQSEQTWRFKTPQEYIEMGNQITTHNRIELDSMDDILDLDSGLEDPYELEDLRAFTDLLKRMLTVDPAERITPDEALNHCFITMSHLPRTCNSPYVRSAHEHMRVCQIKQEATTSTSLA